MAKWDISKLKNDDLEIIDSLDEILKSLERAEFNIQKSILEIQKTIGGFKNEQ